LSGCRRCCGAGGCCPPGYALSGPGELASLASTFEGRLTSVLFGWTYEFQLQDGSGQPLPAATVSASAHGLTNTFLVGHTRLDTGCGQFTGCNIDENVTPYDATESLSVAADVHPGRSDLQMYRGLPTTYGYRVLTGYGAVSPIQLTLAAELLATGSSSGGVEPFLKSLGALTFYAGCPCDDANGLVMYNPGGGIAGSCQPTEYGVPGGSIGIGEDIVWSIAPLADLLPGGLSSQRADLVNTATYHPGAAHGVQIRRGLTNYSYPTMIGADDVSINGWCDLQYSEDSDPGYWGGKRYTFDLSMRSTRQRVFDTPGAIFNSSIQSVVERQFLSALVRFEGRVSEPGPGPEYPLLHQCPQHDIIVVQGCSGADVSECCAGGSLVCSKRDDDQDIVYQTTMLPTQAITLALAPDADDPAVSYAVQNKPIPGTGGFGFADPAPWTQRRGTEVHETDPCLPPTGPHPAAERESHLVGIDATGIFTVLGRERLTVAPDASPDARVVGLIWAWETDLTKRRGLVSGFPSPQRMLVIVRFSYDTSTGAYNPAFSSLSVLGVSDGTWQTSVGARLTAVEATSPCLSRLRTRSDGAIVSGATVGGVPRFELNYDTLVETLNLAECAPAASPVVGPVVAPTAAQSAKLMAERRQGKGSGKGNAKKKGGGCCGGWRDV